MSRLIVLLLTSTFAINLSVIRPGTKLALVKKDLFQLQAIQFNVVKDVATITIKSRDSLPHPITVTEYVLKKAEVDFGVRFQREGNHFRLLDDETTTEAVVDALSTTLYNLDYAIQTQKGSDLTLMMIEYLVKHRN